MQTNSYVLRAHGHGGADMSENIPPEMSPEASPGQVDKKGKKKGLGIGVRRVNNLPLAIIGGALLLFLVVIALVASDRANKEQDESPAIKSKGGDTSLLAKEIVGDSEDGFIPASRPDIPVDSEASEPAPNAIPVQVVRPANLEAPPAPPSLQERDDRLERIRMAKLQMFEEAVRAKTAVNSDSPRSRASSAPTGSAPYGGSNSNQAIQAKIAAVRQQIENVQRDDPTAAYQARLQQIKAAGLVGTGETSPSSPPTPPRLQQTSGGSDYAQFNGNSDRWRLDSQPEAPVSPYTLRAGFVIPGTLISGINSDLPGQIVAQVSQNVYDTPTGKHLLIPLGSRLVGSYSNDVAYGQKRVLIAWQRIIFPDGKAMDIGSMPGADGAGYSGLSDQVNNHYLRVFGSAFLMSGVVAAVTYNQDRINDNSDSDSANAGNAMSEALGQQLGQVMAQMIAKNLNISPTLEIRPGFRFNVIVIKDMAFSKPYQHFDY